MQVKEEIRKYLSTKVIQGYVEELRDDAQLISSGLIDSISIIKVILFLENRFGICLCSDDLNPENFESILAMENLIYRKENENGENQNCTD